MITFAICDDEPLMARELAGHLANYMEEKSLTDYDLSSFSTSCALLESADSFDVIFLDIQMEQPDGMETAKLLRQRGVHSLLIFVTVLKECVFDSFQVERDNPNKNYVCFIGGFALMLDIQKIRA